MVIINVNGKQYKLELRARMVETLEMTLKSKRSLVDIFMPVDIKTEKKNNNKGKEDFDINAGNFKFCSLSDMLRIFWAELQVNNEEISYDKACDIYDDYVKTDEAKKQGAIGFYFMLGRAAGFFPEEEQTKK